MRDEGAGAQFAADLLAEVPEGDARRAAERVLLRWQGVTVYLPRSWRLAARRRAAATLRAAGVSDAEAVRVLRERTGCSESSARRTLREVKRGTIEG